VLGPLGAGGGGGVIVTVSRTTTGRIVKSVAVGSGPIGLPLQAGQPGRIYHVMD
jgi:hypothetical protein